MHQLMVSFNSEALNMLGRKLTILHLDGQPLIADNSDGDQLFSELMEAFKKAALLCYTVCTQCV